METIQQIYENQFTHWTDIGEHLPTLKNLSDEVSTVTEFGVRGGVSTTAFLASKAKSVKSYDIHRWPIVDIFIQACNAEGRYWEFFHTSTLECIIEPTELLFIDTLHTADQLSAELNRHHSKVSKYLVFHDTETFGEAGEIPGSLGLMYSIRNFLTQYPDWFLKAEYKNNNGLVILEKK